MNRVNCENIVQPIEVPPANGENIVQQIEVYPADVQLVLNNAVRDGHLDLIIYVIEHEFVELNYNHIINNIPNTGLMEIIRYLIKNDPLDRINF